MKADLHTHTICSKDSLTRPADLVVACVRRGVDVVAVTDHNAIAGALAAREVAEQMRAAGQEAPLVIVGEEIMTTAGEIMGLFLSEFIPPGLSPQETIQGIREQGGFVTVPHPFDRLRRGPMMTRVLEVIWPHIDAIETRNARTTFVSDNERARAFAVGHGLLQTAGSDAHIVSLSHPDDVEHPQAYLRLPGDLFDSAILRIHLNRERGVVRCSLFKQRIQTGLQVSGKESVSYGRASGFCRWPAGSSSPGSHPGSSRCSKASGGAVRQTTSPALSTRRRFSSFNRAPPPRATTPSCSKMRCSVWPSRRRKPASPSR